MTANPDQQPNSAQANLKDWTFYEKQAAALDLIQSPEVLRMLYGGAKGGGKSTFGVRWCYLMCLALIREFKLPETDQPIPVGFMGRLQGTDLMSTTMDTWRAEIPATSYEIRQTSSTSGEIIIHHRVMIRYSGLDKQKGVRKFNSAELVFAFIDQAEEVPKEKITELEAALRRKIDGRDATGYYKILYTANPGPSWLKPEFITNPQPGDVFVQALPKDNPFLKKGYADDLGKIYRNRPEMLAAYLEGCWDAFEGSDQIIKELWLRNAMTRHLHLPKNKRYITVDPAGFGDDETAIYVWNNTKIIDQEVFGQKSGPFIEGRARLLAIKHECTDIGIDACGLGAGAVGYWHQNAGGLYQVHEIISSGKPTDPLFVNLRAEMWWRTAQLLGDGDVESNELDEQLIIELTTPKYRYVKGRFLVEKKEDLRDPDRLGRSPDRADAYVYGLGYMYDRVVPVEDRVKMKKVRYSYLQRSRMAASAMSV